MDVTVSGHQMDTGDVLRTHVDQRMQAIADKYFSRAISAQATFGKGPHDSVTCDIKAHVMQGLILKGQNQARDAHTAFDGAADKIEKQLRRYMRRLKDKSGQGADAQILPAEMAETAGYTIFDGGVESDDEAGDAPLIIAETRVDVPEASVNDAVMMLDLRNTNALLFVNAMTRAHNMVYRRADGTIGWVEPPRSVSA